MLVIQKGGVCVCKAAVVESAAFTPPAASHFSLYLHISIKHILNERFETPPPTYDTKLGD